MSPGSRRILRRCLVLAALMFWQGGFTFYASVVVPVGRAQLQSLFSYVTQQVTHYLNLAGVAALLLLAWDARATRAGRLAWLLWAGLVVTLAALFFLHRPLDVLMDEGASLHALRPWHRTYLWVSTVQWFLGVGYLPVLIQGWRREDAEW